MALPRSNADGSNSGERQVWVNATNRSSQITEAVL